MPRRASLESVAAPDADEQLAAVVRAADVIYLPTDRLGSVLASEPAWKLMQVMRRSGADFAVAWDAIDSSEQSRLDEWLNRRSSSADFPGHLDLFGNARERENCRAFLRQTRPLHIRHLALRCPQQLVEKLRAGNALTAADETLVPRGFDVPRDGLQTFAQRAPELRSASDIDRAAFYRAAVVANEFAAERIIDQLKEHEGGKLLVFLRRADLDNAQGVPFFVAQKLNVRQVVLDSKQPGGQRANLLTWSGRAASGW